MIALEEALARMAGAVAPLAPKRLPLLQLDGLTLAEDCFAQRTNPPFAVSAMDGYALPGAPVPGATYQVIGEVPAGAPEPQQLHADRAMRIFTGARIPDGTAYVVIQEDVTHTDDRITLGHQLDGKTNIRPQGGDIKQGDLLLAKGTTLTPQAIALAASGNHETLLVHPRPRITILMNGDELAWPGKDAPEHAIIASNGFGLAALIERLGATSEPPELVRDDLSAIQGVVGQFSGDVLVTVGGASVGKYDLVRPALEAEGFTLSVPKVALRPGKPTLFGQKGTQIVLGLPGNPVSAMVSAMIFLPALINALKNRTDTPLLALKPAKLAVSLDKNGPRAHFMRAKFGDNGALTPVSSQDSSLLRLLSHADALLHRPAHAPAARAGDSCDYLPLPA